MAAFRRLLRQRLCRRPQPRREAQREQVGAYVAMLLLSPVAGSLAPARPIPQS